MHSKATCQGTMPQTIGVDDTNLPDSSLVHLADWSARLPVLTGPSVGPATISTRLPAGARATRPRV
jgi:hypothetical protein